MTNLPILSDVTDIQRVEAEYMTVLFQYKARFGLAASMRVNHRLQDRGWGSGKSHKEFVLDLISDMKGELGQ